MSSLCFPPGLEPVHDLAPVAWVRKAIGEHPGRRLLVGDLVPPVFDAYARVLHRIRVEEAGQPLIRTWTERATELGHRLGPTATWWDVIGIPPFGAGSGDPQPEIGRLTKHEVESLASALDPSDGQDACWFGIWSGWGFLSAGGHGELRPRGSWFSELRQRRRVEREAPRDEAHEPPRTTVIGEPCFLIRGKVNDAARFMFHGWFQSPTLWWPDDRSWFVHTEIDAMSTYIGGSHEMIDSLVGQQILEPFEVEEDTPAAL
jgi:hypothetical protein